LNTIDGYNGCIFVYGQTGSGKTHTMIGEDNGIMQRSFRELFIRLNAMNAESFSVSCSYFELYNEQILDLIDPKK
jgi:DNA replication protein DnaC